MPMPRPAALLAAEVAKNTASIEARARAAGIGWRI